MPIPDLRPLPQNILADLKRVRDDLLGWSGLPQFSPDVVRHWDGLIDEWIQDTTIPLIVRKSTHDKVCYLIDHPIRKIAPSDNSPAHWVAMQCHDGSKPTLGEIKIFMTSAASPIPMSMILSKAEIKLRPPFPVPLTCLPHPGKKGWYLAHRVRVATGIPARIEEADIKQITNHFRLFMSPSNMMLIPKQVAALAELDFFFEIDDA